MELDLCSPETIKFIRRKYNFRNAKSLGQNFLTDSRVVEEIVRGAGIGKDDFVVEIGPGIGALTREAAKHAAQVAAVEIDERLIPILEADLSDFDNVRIINGDILKTDVDALASESGFTDRAHVKIIGNLPYYITTPVLTALLKKRVNAESITVMMQKEVADRIGAPVGTKEYGALTIAVRYYCDVVRLIEVPHTSFMPQPKVDSVVLRLDVKKEKSVKVADEGLFFSCVRAGFSQRRKTVSNSLKSVLPGTGQAAVFLESLGIDPKRRAETLSIEDFAAIANAISRVNR